MPGPGADPSPRWPGRPAEYAADAAVHAIWLALGAIALAWVPVRGAGPAHLVYAATLPTLAILSLINNLAPRGFAGGWIGRLDRAAIYPFIAASVGAFLTLGEPSISATVILTAVWVGAGLGAAAKLVAPKRFGRTGMALYLGLGWCAMAGLADVAPYLGTAGVALLLVGGALYTAGVPFHRAERLPFRSAIWHGLVTAGVACHLAAVLIGLEAASGRSVGP